MSRRKMDPTLERRATDPSVGEGRGQRTDTVANQRFIPEPGLAAALLGGKGWPR